MWPICSSLFREMRNYQKDYSSWCGECQREKKHRQHQSVAATKMVEAFTYVDKFIQFIIVDTILNWFWILIMTGISQE